MRTDATGRTAFDAVPVPDAGAGLWYPALTTAGRTTLAAWVRQTGATTVIAVGSVP